MQIISSGGSRISQRRGRQPPRWGCQYNIWSNIPENCMKMKEFGPREGGRVPGAPLRSANDQRPFDSAVTRLLRQIQCYGISEINYKYIKGGSSLYSMENATAITSDFFAWARQAVWLHPLTHLKPSSFNWYSWSILDERTNLVTLMFSTRGETVSTTTKCSSFTYNWCVFR